VIFSDAMTSLISVSRGEIADHVNLAGARTVADIGGAAGALLAAILERDLELRGILYERPAVIDDVRRDAPAVLRERCEFLAGDFMERVPSADVLILSHVLHDWPDADAVRLLTNCRAALPPHGRVIVLDHVMEPGDAPDPAKLLDLEMLAMNAGRERTRAEFERLFAQAGLRLTGVTPLHGTALVEAVAAEGPGQART
jgi:SAM-dependent methyltransferase